MQKTLYFKSANQRHFIEVENSTDFSKSFRVYFPSGNTNLFKVENSKISDFPDFDNGYKITVDRNSYAYLEISPRCLDVNIDASVKAVIEAEDNNSYDTYTLALSIRKNEYKKGISDFIGLDKKFSNFQKEINDTFSINSIYPKLTGNLKFRISSNGNLYVSLMENVRDRYNKNLFNKKVKLGSNLLNELKNISDELLEEKESFYEYYANRNFTSNSTTPYTTQNLDDIYNAGVSSFPSKFFNEQLSITAPLYLGNSIPKYFVIFKKQEYKDINKKDFFKDLKIVKTFNLSDDTEIGSFIKNTKNSRNYDKEHVELEWRENSPILKVNGIDIREGIISTKYENMYDYLNSEERLVSEFETYITNAYIRNSMISHRIFNFEFLFDDDDTEFSSYFGMYCDDLNIDEFDIDLVKYTNEQKLKALEGNEISITELYTNSKKIIDDKYVNDGKRVFYLKDPNNNFHFLDTVESVKNNNVFKVKDLDLSNFVCKSNTHVINENTDVVDFTAYNEFEFTENFNVSDSIELHEINKKYVFKFETDETFLVYDKISHFPQDTGILSASVISGEHAIKLNDIEDLSQGDSITIINNDDSEIETTISDISYNGEETIIRIPDSDDVSNIAYINYNIPECEMVSVKIADNLEQSLARLANAINTLTDVPFTATLIDSYKIRIESNRNIQFDTFLNFSYSSSSFSGIKHFNNTITPDAQISDSISYDITRKKFTSPYPLFNREKMVKFPTENFIGNSNKAFISGGDIISLNPNGEGYDNIIQRDNDYLFRIKDMARPREGLELFEICKTSVGVFSFYEVKDYDFSKLSTDQNFYTSEYNMIYKKYNPLEILQPAQYYRVKNSGEIDLSITITYSLNDSFNSNDLDTLIIRPGEEKYFSTFLSDYDLNVFKDSVQFRYRYDYGDSFSVTPYFLKLDSILNRFTPTYPSNALNLLGLKNISDNLAKDGDPDYIKLYNTKSEYSRLQENKVVNNDLSKFINPTFVKWESPEYIDSKGDWLRLSFSKAFGKTGHTTHYSNYEVNTEAHSHEWFMLDEIPSGMEIYEKSQQIYGFDKIDRSLLLDTTTDYFNEYFNSGYPNIKRGDSSIGFIRKQNYSKVKKIGQSEYETFYKGVKYRFTGDKNLEDYSFSVITSTRPGNSKVSEAFETHCITDVLDYKCNVKGLLPELKSTIDRMTSGDQTLNLNVSIVQPGAPVHLDGKLIGTSAPLELVEFTESEFLNTVNESFLEWVNLIQYAYSKENKMASDLTLNYTIDNEVAPIPVIQSSYNDQIKEEFGIGNIRIAVVDDIIMQEKAATFFVTTQSYDSDFEYLTPTIVINAKSFFRPDNVTPANGAYSLLYILIHEIGHVFGLGHTLKEDSIMNPNIKVSDNYRDKFPTGLYSFIDGECIVEAYGNSFDTSIAETVFSCDSNPKIANDNYEILVNDKYKTITVKIESDLDSYLTLDSKKSYLDIYLTQDFKRITIVSDDNFIPKLEPSDIQVPMLDLSFKSLEFKDDNIKSPFINTFIIELNNFNLGISPEKSFYRLRNSNNSSKNYQFNAFMLSATSMNYFLNESYDEQAQINKTAISTISNNSNTAVSVNYPLNTLEYYQSSNFWRILGGNSVVNGNYKLSLDYFSSILSKIPHTTVTDSGSISNIKEFELNIISPSKIEVKTSKYLDGTLDNFEVKNSNNKNSLFRHEAEFNPKYDEIIFFGLRDDLDFSTSMGIDFFKCNTRILYENPKFGKIVRVKKKISDVPIYTNDQILNLGASNSPLYENSNNILKTSADSDFYKIFTTETEYSNISGFKDFKTIKSFNSLIFPRFDNIEYTIPSDLLVFNKTTNNLSAIIDYDTSIRNALVSVYEDSYSKIYSKDNSDFDESLLNFIENSVLRNYEFNEIQYFEQYSSSGTNYVTDNTGLNRIKSLNSYIELQNLIFNKTVRYDVNFSVKLIFKFI